MAPPKIVDAASSRPRHGRLRRRHPVRRLVGYVALGLVVLLVAGVGVAGISLLRLQGQVETVDLAQGGEAPPAFAEQQGAFNILLVGSDSREGQASVDDGYEGGELNDVTMLLHVSDDHTRATVVSFPRDLIIDFPACPDPEGGKDLPAVRKQQLNTALGRGGLACVAAVVSSLSGLDVPYGAVIGFDGVVAMSTAVGGVPVCFAGDVKDRYTGFSATEGTHELQGEDALKFLRMRHGVGDGSDLARISSQQVFLSSLIRKLQSDAVLTDLSRLYQVAQVASQNMTLSTSLNDVGTMVSMARVLADIPLETMQFIQYPSASTGDGRVAPTANADEVMELIATDQPLTLDPNATGEGAESTAVPSGSAAPSSSAAPSTGAAPSTSAKPSTSASPSATAAPSTSASPSASVSASPSDAAEGVQGTSAAQETCVVPFDS